MKSRSEIEEILNSVHRHIGRAGFLVITMIVKRSLWKSSVGDIRYHLGKAQEKLGELDDWTKHS